MKNLFKEKLEELREVLTTEEIDYIESDNVLEYDYGFTRTIIHKDTEEVEQVSLNEITSIDELIEELK